MTRILIIAGDVLPFPGYPTTGAGLRAWSLGEGLRSRGFEIFFSMPCFHVKEGDREQREFCWSPDDREKPIRMLKPDVLVACHWPAMPARRLDIPTVLDLHGPHLMERSFWDHQEARRGTWEKIEAFRKADLVICAGQRQRYYFSNWLMLAGFPLDSELIRVVPVSLSPDIPARNAPDPGNDGPRIVYGGMFLPWQDPIGPLKVLLEVMRNTDRGHLQLFGGPHPLVKDSSGRFERLMQDLSDHPRVSISKPTARDELLAHYSKAHLAFDLMAPNLERELAFTTRTVEYLWCGLPVIYNDYAELSGFVAQHQAGWTVDPDKPDLLQKLLTDIVSGEEDLLGPSQRAQDAIRQHLTWDKTIAPLADFCSNPRKTQPGQALIEQTTIPPPPPSTMHRIRMKIRSLLG